MATMPRVQAVAIPILRAALVPGTFAKVGSWVEDIDYRTFPILNVRRLGGFRHRQRPTQLALPVIELTAYGVVDLPTTEQTYETALEVLYDAVKRQTQVSGVGYLHSIKETLGATQFSSLYQDSWRIQGLIQLGVRPPRS